MARGEAWGGATTLKQAATINSLPPEWLPFVEHDAHWPAALRQNASAIELQFKSSRAQVPQVTAAKNRDGGNHRDDASVDVFSQSSGLSEDEIAIAAHMARMVQTDVSSARNHAHASASQSGPFFHFLDCPSRNGSQPSVGAPSPPRLESIDSFKSLADLAVRSAFSPYGSASPASSEHAGAAVALSRSSSEMDGCDLSLSLGSPSVLGAAAEAERAWASTAEVWGAEVSMEQSGESGQGGYMGVGGMLQANSGCANGWLLRMPAGMGRAGQGAFTFQMASMRIVPPSLRAPRQPLIMPLLHPMPPGLPFIPAQHPHPGGLSVCPIQSHKHPFSLLF
ncbi:unnamed protein product [Closterium sp. Naga37s-1]|nr:unnamed protein product [Closterium sp. Naga37s-1]